MTFMNINDARYAPDVAGLRCGALGGATSNTVTLTVQ